MRPLPTAPLVAGSLIAAWAVVAATGSRPLGGVVLAIGGLCCIWIWMRRHGRRTAARLGGIGFAAFVVSHVLALAVGPWPAVLIVAGATAAAAWALADAELYARGDRAAEDAVAAEHAGPWHSARGHVRFAPWHKPPSPLRVAPSPAVRPPAPRAPGLPDRPARGPADRGAVVLRS